MTYVTIPAPDHDVDQVTAIAACLEADGLVHHIDGVPQVWRLAAWDAYRMPAHNWWTDGAAPCGRCGAPTPRYGPDVASTLCGPCRTSQATGAQPDGTPTQPNNKE